ncbi:MAG TPA: sugar isomerase, partial [Phytomonospora sp.]
VWFFGTPPDGLLDQVRATGAYASVSPADPLAELVRAQRLAVAVAAARGLDPDRPRHLTRSVILAP